jgi:hypothetical protein
MVLIISYHSHTLSEQQHMYTYLFLSMPNSMPNHRITFQYSAYNHIQLWGSFKEQRLLNSID